MGKRIPLVAFFFPECGVGDVCPFMLLAYPPLLWKGRKGKKGKGRKKKRKREKTKKTKREREEMEKKD
jgi:hypothetical protein